MAKNKSAKCSICGVIDESLFYKGQKSLCKEHYKEKVRAHREANAEYYKEYDRNRANIPERIALRKAYQKTIAFKDSHSVAVKKYNAANTARKEARSAVGHAIRDGKIDRLPCCICGSEKSEAHHVAYNLPLDVVWLCDKHHKEVHKMHRSILRNTNQPPT